LRFLEYFPLIWGSRKRTYQFTAKIYPYNRFFIRFLRLGSRGFNQTQIRVTLKNVQDRLL